VFRLLGGPASTHLQLLGPKASLSPPPNRFLVTMTARKMAGPE
jgi:hypothetical protein